MGDCHSALKQYAWENGAFEKDCAGGRVAH